MAQATAAIAAAETRIKTATRRARPREWSPRPAHALDEAQGHEEEARKALNGGDYYAALSAASAATQSAKAATEKLDAAPPATPRRRPGTS